VIRYAVAEAASPVTTIMYTIASMASRAVLARPAMNC
jgi:hypothetical protein